MICDNAGYHKSKKVKEYLVNSRIELVLMPKTKNKIWSGIYKKKLTVLLAAGHVLWPVAGVGLLVVEQAADTELFRSRPVPAGPVAGAGRLVTEDPVQPVTVLRALGRI